MYSLFSIVFQCNESSCLELIHLFKILIVDHLRSCQESIVRLECQYLSGVVLEDVKLLFQYSAQCAIVWCY